MSEREKSMKRNDFRRNERDEVKNGNIYDKRREYGRGREGYRYYARL